MSVTDVVIDVTKFLAVYPQFALLPINEVIYELEFCIEEESLDFWKPLSNTGSGGAIFNKIYSIYNRAVGLRTAHILTWKYANGIYKTYADLVNNPAPEILVGLSPQGVVTSSSVGGISTTLTLTTDMTKINDSKGNLMMTCYGQEYLALVEQRSRILY